MSNFLNYAYVFATIGLTVYGQLIIKWRVDEIGKANLLNSSTNLPKWMFFRDLLLDPLVASGFLAAFLASLTWMIALSKFPLNHIYPMTSLSFVLVGVLSWHLFGEAMLPNKIAGLLLIVLGIVVASYK